MTVLMVEGPVLTLSLLVGPLVSIFQATTQIQEQTLTFVPKRFWWFSGLLSCWGRMLRIMIDFTNRLFMNMTQFIG